MKRFAALLAPVLLLLSVLSSSPADAQVPGLAFTATGCEGYSDGVARLYTAGLGRDTEQEGYEFWLVSYTQGIWNLGTMATFFATSEEFITKYGTLDQDGYVRQIYQNVLDRPGEDEGVAYWNSRMDDGMTRGELLLSFSESPENITRSGTSQPTLGDYNLGLTSSWSCDGWTPPNPGDVKNCGDFTYHEEAQNWFLYYNAGWGDIAKLDFDNNGVACESLPHDPNPADKYPYLNA